MTLPSEFDNVNFIKSRKFIDSTRQFLIDNYLKSSDVICDIGNQGKHIPALSDFKCLTLYITESNNLDFVEDITKFNTQIKDEYFDVIMCTEVLEHVVDPFSAIRELRRIVKTGGYILFTTPLNARIHGPVPDCWRFTEFGLKILFRDFEIVHFNKLDTQDRNLFCITLWRLRKKNQP